MSVVCSDLWLNVGFEHVHETKFTSESRWYF